MSWKLIRGSASVRTARPGRAARTSAWCLLSGALVLTAFGPGRAEAGGAAASGSDIPTQRCRSDEAALADWQTVTAGLGHGVTRLNADGMAQSPELMTRVLDLGQIEARSFNPMASITRIGTPLRLPERWSAATGDAEKDQRRKERNRANANGYFGGSIDLRFDFEHWVHAFAVERQSTSGCMQRSLVFFDARGVQVHAVSLANSSHDAAYQALVSDFSHARQTVPEIETAVQRSQAAHTEDAAVDLPAYHKAWLAMTDVHQFPALLREFHLGREQAMRLAPPGKARRLAGSALHEILLNAAAQNLPFMVFVSNDGITQVFGGTIHTVRQQGDWLIVDDPDVYLAFDRAAVAGAWHVERGGIHSIDFYDASSNLITSLFGVRDKEHPVPVNWIKLLDALPPVAGS